MFLVVGYWVVLSANDVRGYLILIRCRKPLLLLRDEGFSVCTGLAIRRGRLGALALGGSLASCSFLKLLKLPVGKLIVSGSLTL